MESFFCNISEHGKMQYGFRIKAFFGCAFLFFFAWFSFRDIFSLWWTYDDTQILKFVSEYSPYQYFTQPSIWWEYTNRFLTPLQILSFGVDKFLFLYTPKWFYVHHLFVISLCSCAMFLFLSKYLPVSVSLIGATFFLIGSPTTIVIQQLMDRHYIEGLLLSFMSIFCFIKAIESGQMRWSYSSATTYALSMAYKEVFIPILLILLVLPQGMWRSRLKYAIPHFGVLLLYIIWRWWMLGTPFGGYGTGISAASVLMLPHNVLKLFFDITSPLSICLIAVIGVSSVILWFGKWKHLMFIIVSAIVIVLPIVPVSSGITYRHIFIVWTAAVFFSVFTAYLCWTKGIIGKFICILIIPISFFVVASQSIRNWNSNLAEAKRFTAEGLFVFNNAQKSSNILRRPFPSFGYYFNGVLWLAHLTNTKEEELKPVWFYDDIYLCENDLGDKRIWEYDKKSQNILEITDSIYSIRNNYCPTIKTDAPLEVSVRYSGDTVSWEFGPYRDGHYFYIFQDGSDGNEVPRMGRLRLHLLRDRFFRIRYSSPAGWSSYSSVLVLKRTATGSVVQWKRGS